MFSISGKLDTNLACMVCWMGGVKVTGVRLCFRLQECT